ncbi:polyprenyl synthetase family protein [Candidatus Gracilibacteria bacterium 28_42_T64]|nr:polyprenyl synthetase family protein [Candidatus Gracilibacteria bacterium 28_42_T64]
MLPSWYSDYKSFIDKSIESYLKTYFNNKVCIGSEKFKDIILYATKGGKRIRSIFALEIYLIFSNKPLSTLDRDDDIVKFIISLECMHAYSLIHDDLPCMDDDEYRRGELTTWKKFGEYQAVLAGDLLNTLSFEILSQISDPKIAISLVQLLSSHTGFYGMVGGQVDDMYFECNKEALTHDNLVGLHNKKTGALIKSSIIGALIVANSNSDIEKYSIFGEKIGLAFQIKDDILDIEGSLKDTGKSVGGEKKGFVHFMGLEKTKKELEALIEYCLNSAKELNSEKLEFIVRYIGERKR